MTPPLKIGHIPKSIFAVEKFKRWITLLKIYFEFISIIACRGVRYIDRRYGNFREYPLSAISV